MFSSKIYKNLSILPTPKILTTRFINLSLLTSRGDGSKPFHASLPNQLIVFALRAFERMEFDWFDFFNVKI
jgi:hypothetical protein